MVFVCHGFSNILFNRFNSLSRFAFEFPSKQKSLHVQERMRAIKLLAVNSDLACCYTNEVIGFIRFSVLNKHKSLFSMFFNCHIGSFKEVGYRFLVLS